MMWGYPVMGSNWGAYGLFSYAFGLVLFVDLALLGFFLWLQIQNRK